MRLLCALLLVASTVHAQSRPRARDLGVPFDGTPGPLNDINGFHVTKQHAFAALDSARGGPVVEGSVGGGTGMICNQFKGGIGTASRRLPADRGGYTIGVLVQCNYGSRARLSIAGVPVGQEIPDLMPCYDSLPGTPIAGRHRLDADKGSIIIVIGTGAPLLPHPLQRSGE